MDKESLKTIKILGNIKPSKEPKQRTLQRSLTLNDLSNANLISNPFKIIKSETENLSLAGPLASLAGPLASLAGPLASSTGPLASSTGPLTSSTGILAKAKAGTRLKQSCSLNPFSLKKSESESRISIDNPFNILRGQDKSFGELHQAVNQSTGLENPIILKRKRVCIEKENIPPEVLEKISTKEDIPTLAEPAPDSSDSEESLDENGPLDFITSTSKSSSKSSSNKGSLKNKQFYVERNSLPIDWSLKKSFTITSNFSLDWIIIMMNNRNGKFPTAESTSLLSNQFDQSRLFFWSAFELPMPPSHSNIVSRILAREMKNSHTNSKKSINQRTAAMTEIEKAEYSFFKDREDQWKKAFQSAYKRVKTGELSYLCYENSLFLMAFVNLDNQGMKGYMSRSTPGFRLILKEQEIEYSLLDGNGVYLETDIVCADDHEILEGFEDLIKKRENSETRKPPNALFFQNAKCCHAIFDFLLNWTDPKVEIRAQGPPKLASSGPFLGASISQCAPSKPMFIIQGDKSSKSEMKIKSFVNQSTQNQDDNVGFWNATVKNGNAGLCPLMIRGFAIHAASIFEDQIAAQENPGKEDYELKIIFENDSDVSSFKGGNVFDGTLLVKSLIYSKGKFQLNTV